jgi:hypothetical protein
MDIIRAKMQALFILKDSGLTGMKKTNRHDNFSMQVRRSVFRDDILCDLTKFCSDWWEI